MGNITMQLGDKLAIAMVPIGLGVAALGIGIPVMFPHMPILVASSLVYGGSALVLLGIVVFLFLHIPWRRLFRREQLSIDDPRGWSVSISTPRGTVGSNLGGAGYDICFQMFRMVNVSKVRNRILDVEIVLPFRDGTPPLYFRSFDHRKAEYQRRVEEHLSTDVTMWRTLQCIQFPIVLEPEQMVEAQMVFHTNDDRLGTLGPDYPPEDFSGATFCFTEHLSGQSRALGIGVYYDAVAGKESPRIISPSERKKKRVSRP